MTHSGSKIYFFICLVAGLVVFAGDLLFKTEIAAGGTPYILIIVFACWLEHKKYIFFLAALFSVFIITGYFISDQEVTSQMALITRIVALIGVWFLLIFVFYHRNSVNELKDKENSFKTLFESATEAMILSDGKGNIVMANQSALNMFGYEREELLNENIDKLVPKRFRPSHDHYRKEYYNDLTPRPMGAGRDLYALKKDGSEFPVEISLSSYKIKGNLRVISFIIDITERKQADSNLMNAMLEGQEQERKRVAAELHDGLAQILSAININMNVIEQEINYLSKDNAERFQNAKSLLENAVKETRSISHNLLPGSLEESGLFKAVEDICVNIEKSSQIKINLYCNVTNPRYKRSIEIGLYRIFQELINNITKHADATEVNVQFVEHDKNSLLMMVEDNGVGFNEDTDELRHKGFGFKNITARAKSLNGSLNIDSYPGKGTSVSIEVPIEG